MGGPRGQEGCRDRRTGDTTGLGSGWTGRGGYRTRGPVRDETVHATPVDVELGSGFSEGPLAMGRPCCAHHVAEGDGGVLDHLPLRVESRRSGSHVRPPHICLGQ